jgi:type IV pilus assembly protein PilE
MGGTRSSRPADPADERPPGGDERRQRTAGSPDTDINNRAMPALRTGCPRRGHGFTLMELMIAIAIVAILAAVALPIYFDSIRKGRRSEAISALTAVQQAQERWRANNAAYTTALTASAPDGLGLAATTGNGMYTLTIDEASAIGYTVTAAAVSTGAQADDKRCASLRVKQLRGNVLYGSACKTCSLADPPTDPNRCWSRQ